VSAAVAATIIPVPGHRAEVIAACTETVAGDPGEGRL